MWQRILVINLVTGLFLLLVWYYCFVRYTRHRALRVLKWIEHAFEGNGEIAAVEWITASRLSLRLRLWPNLFRHTSLSIQFHPRELPFSWLIARLRRREETLTFEADLDFAPGFNLEVHNHRWCGRTRRRFPAASENWIVERTGPFVITTRRDWQREITNLMQGLVASRECDCIRVAFSKTSPHFSATVPLETLSPEAQSQANIFDVMRDLAAGASASRF